MPDPDDTTAVEREAPGTAGAERGSVRPVYGAGYFEHGYDQNGVARPYRGDEHWMTVNGQRADNIVRSLRPASVLDVGCGLGLLVEALRDRGVDACGFDVSSYAIERAHDSVRGHVWQAPLTKPIEGRYDVVTLIEVIEHLPRSEAAQAVANICAATDTVLLSSGPADFTEPAHLNVRPPEDWTVLFAQNGFIRDLDYDAAYLAPWAALYRRVRPDLVEVVRAYDRWHWRLAEERDEVRTAIVALKNRLDASTGEVSGVTVGAIGETVRSLRDQVIGLEAELGEALGHLTELQAVEGSYRRLSEQFQANHDEYVRSREVVAEYEAIERSSVLGVVRRALKRYTQARLKFGMGLK